jgi:hypothetical protein
VREIKRSIEKREHSRYFLYVVLRIGCVLWLFDISCQSRTLSAVVRGVTMVSLTAGLRELCPKKKSKKKIKSCQSRTLSAVVRGVTMVSLNAGLRELCPIVRDATFPRVGREEAEALLRPVNG